MLETIMTQYTGTFVGPVARLLGYIMNWIYVFMEKVFHVQNIGLCIIIFTVVVYLCLLPLTIKQQKYSRLSQKMQPEIKEIQNKYKNKKDQNSMIAMNDEIKAVQAKYGVSPSGTCLQALIQMPIIFGLYRVIYSIPAYVTGVKEQFTPVVEGIMATEGYQDKLTNLVNEIGLKTPTFNFKGTNVEAANSIIDVLYKLPSSAWENLKNSFSGIEGLIGTLETNLEHMNYFLGINISDTPSELIKTGFSNGQFLLVLGALIVPVLSAAVSFISYKLMPNTAATENPDDPMMSTVKTMNYTMPLVSFFLVYATPIGIGIYWIAGPVIRTMQMFLINKYYDKIDIDELIKKNQEKAKKKLEKKGIAQNQISNAARMNTRSMSEKAQVSDKVEEKLTKKQEYNNIKPGSLAEKANLVKEFNERNNK